MKAGQRYIDVTFVFRQEGDAFTAECLELGTVSCGDTLEEAGANIAEAVALHLKILDELGEPR